MQSANFDSQCFSTMLFSSPYSCWHTYTASRAGEQADEQSNEQSNEQAGEQAGEQASEQAGEQAGEQANEQAGDVSMHARLAELHIKCST